MVRLVFRPYTRVGRSICTSEPRRSSTRVSSGFDLPGHSSPSFGSRHMRSVSLPPSRRCREGPTVRSPRREKRSRLGANEPPLRLHYALGFFDPSDSRMCQTPRSVIREGSGEVPTRAQASRSSGQKQLRCPPAFTLRSWRAWEIAAVTTGSKNGHGKLKPRRGLRTFNPTRVGHRAEAVAGMRESGQTPVVPHQA